MKVFWGIFLLVVFTVIQIVLVRLAIVSHKRRQSKEE